MCVSVFVVIFPFSFSYPASKSKSSRWGGVLKDTAATFLDSPTRNSSTKSDKPGTQNEQSCTIPVHV